MFDKRKDGGRGAEPPVSGVAATQTQTPVERRPAPAPRRAAASVIGPGLAVSGNLTGNMDVVIAGEFEGTVDLPAGTIGTPMTYMVDGRQYIAASIGGGPRMVAFALP
jgi:glucose dehydrogenase